MGFVAQTFAPTQEASMMDVMITAEPRCVLAALEAIRNWLLCYEYDVPNDRSWVLSDEFADALDDIQARNELCEAFRDFLFGVCERIIGFPPETFRLGELYDEEYIIFIRMMRTIYVREMRI